MPLDNLNFRPYRPDDLDALHALDIACFERAFRFSRSAMRRFAEAAKARVVIAESNAGIVAFCIVHIKRSSQAAAGYVVTLDIAPAHRRQGLARALMAEAERQCVLAGCVQMVLHVYAHNTTAQKFYGEAGFALSRTEPHFYGPGLDAQTWSKELT